MLIYGLELLLNCIIIWTVVTQIAIPLWFNLPLFPVFRLRKIEDKLKTANEEIVIREIENEVKLLKKDKN